MPTGTTTLSAGIIPVQDGTAGPRVLLLRAYRYWDFPKGEIDPGEDPLAAARRELIEETGLGDIDFRWGAVYIETERYGRGKIARYYLAQVNDGEVQLPVSPELGRAEHDEYRWVTPAEASDLLNDRVRRVLTWACSHMGC